MRVADRKAGSLVPGAKERIESESHLRAIMWHLGKTNNKSPKPTATILVPTSGKLEWGLEFISIIYSLAPKQQKCKQEEREFLNILQQEPMFSRHSNVFSHYSPTTCNFLSSILETSRLGSTLGRKCIQWKRILVHLENHV